MIWSRIQGYGAGLSNMEGDLVIWKRIEKYGRGLSDMEED